jgi:predicted small secreted protein
LAINSISINTIISFLLRKKEKEIKIAKEVFRKQARIKEKLLYIRGQKNTILKNNR